MKIPIKLEIRDLLEGLNSDQRTELLYRLTHQWPHSTKRDYFKESKPYKDPESGEMMVLRGPNTDPDAKCTCGADKALAAHFEYVMELHKSV